MFKRNEKIERQEGSYLLDDDSLDQTIETEGAHTHIIAKTLKDRVVDLEKQVQELYTMFQNQKRL